MARRARKTKLSLPSRNDTPPKRDRSTDKGAPSKEDLEFISHVQEEFKKSMDHEKENRDAYEEDIDFGMAGNQWPEAVRMQREEEYRPCLTINRVQQFIRQVVNDARQNTPGMHAAPVDSAADVETAKVIEGIIRHIEYDSSADAAYDTAAETSVAGGFGYMRVALEYAGADSFDMDIKVKRVPNPLAILGDRNSVEADSNDWDYAFVTEVYDETQYTREFGDKAQVSWDSDAWSSNSWRDNDNVTVAEYWERTYEDMKIVQFLDKIHNKSRVLRESDIENRPEIQVAIAKGLFEHQRDRMAKAPVVRQYILSGVEILSQTPWPGTWIPIVPVYGSEYWKEGKRVLRSLINPSKDAQRNYNYWRSASAELVALAPKAPFIGKKGTFASDNRWESVNSQSHPYLEYDSEVPIRQPLDSGPAAGAIQEALNANDDIKATIGMYDASIGARSNEVSGKAILARQREGDVATFHFQDNLNRSIRHLGRIMVELIPQVYSGPRQVRILGEDQKERNVPVNQRFEKTDEEGNVQIVEHDLTLGKYDIRMESGPSYTTRRQEAAEQMTEMARHVPDFVMLAGDILAKNLDWPGASEIAERLEQKYKEAKGQLPPEVENMIKQGKETIAKLQKENEMLKAEHNLKREANMIDKHEAETKRMKVENDFLIDQLPAIPTPGENNG
jgi:hypothetical protein